MGRVPGNVTDGGREGVRSRGYEKGQELGGSRRDGKGGCPKQQHRIKNAVEHCPAGTRRFAPGFGGATS